MAPEEFDISFDFDKEYGLDPNANKSSFDDDFDLDAALERELGPDFDRLFEEEFAASQAALNAKLEAEKKAAEAKQKEEEDEEIDYEDIFEEVFEDDFEDEPEEEPEIEEKEEPFPSWGSFADLEDDEEEEYAEEIMDDPDEDFSAVFAAVTAASAARVEEDVEEEPPEELPAKEPRKRLDMSAIAQRVDLSGIREQFSALGAVLQENGLLFLSALKECKPGKMDRKAKRRFKNDVLPVLIGGVALIVCMTFIIGSLGRAFNSEERKQAALEASIAQAEAEAAAAAEIQQVLATAARQAAGYDYQTAINTLDSYKTEDRELTEEMAIAREEYAAAVNNLVIWDDPTAIPNLSFHVLIADPTRAYASSLARSYQSNFITTEQFSAILEQLHEKGYVLVNLDSCLTETTAADGSTTCTVQPIYLPEGKKPIMITETLVNYFAYMIDGNNDGTPDASGAGFASRLVVKDGKVQAEYVDAQGVTQVGDYDLVPILNSFINANPDFSYRGAKAILAVTGEEGVFGWRTNTGDASMISGAKTVVDALRADGYQIASNSFANLDYGSTSLEEINADLNKWKSDVAPVLGEIDILVVARGGKIEVGSSRFQKVQNAGFHYILDADTVGTKLDAGYFYQNRLMIVGSELKSGAYASYFILPTA